MEILEIEWAGPFSIDEGVSGLNEPADSGIYQIYGTHNVLGPDTLLYVGLTEPPRTFADRIPEHEWLPWEAERVRVFVGRLGGIQNISREDWCEKIRRVEQLLIFFCAPPYNNHLLQPFGDMVPTTVLNFRQRARLPLMVSTLYETSPYAKEDPRWAVYSLR